jgi:methylated-DNA-protein-cysteine methyltransferase-like protein
MSAKSPEDRILAAIRSQNDDATLPWHRVLRSDGRIAFPDGSKAFREQSQRLRAEGVKVENGRVKRPRREDDLDAALWGPGAR